MKKLLNNLIKRQLEDSEHSLDCEDCQDELVIELIVLIRLIFPPKHCLKCKHYNIDKAKEVHKVLER